MQIEYLQVFCDIIETRSFSKAAARNYISQPAVSQQVKALEEHFQQKLIERSPQGIYPTEAGQLFYEGCRQILEQYQNLERKLLDMSENLTGTIRVATVYSVGLHDLPPYVKRFIQLYPQARIHVEYSRTNRIYEAVRQNMVDIGIVAYPQEGRHLGVIALPSDEYVLIVSANHPLARQGIASDAPDAGSVSIQLLQGAPFIAFEPDIPTRQALDLLLQNAGIEPMVVQEFDNVETVKRSVEADVGISVVPRRTVRNELKAGSLVAFSFADMTVRRPVGLIYKKGKTFSNTLQKFIQILTDQETPERPPARSSD